MRHGAPPKRKPHGGDRASFDKAAEHDHKEKHQDGRKERGQNIAVLGGYRKQKLVHFFEKLLGSFGVIHKENILAKKEHGAEGGVDDRRYGRYKTHDHLDKIKQEQMKKEITGAELSTASAIYKRIVLQKIKHVSMRQDRCRPFFCFLSTEQ